jgi:hypothetical protein
MRRPALLLALMLALLGGCGRETSSRVEEQTEAGARSPADVLDSLDSRAPLPLLPMMASHQKQAMRDHLLAVQEIVEGLASDDFPAVEAAAARIGLSEGAEQMCTHMGAGAPGFTEQALEFHRRADRITAAARERDRGRVGIELGATLRACTTCHATWKQQVVDEPTWSRLTSSAPPSAGAPPRQP